MTPFKKNNLNGSNVECVGTMIIVKDGQSEASTCYALYYSDDVSIPVAFEVIRKPIQYSEIATRKVKRASTVTKNELMRQMIVQCVQNQLLFATF